MELAGFVYSDILTRLFRKIAQHFKLQGSGEAQHIVYTSHVYINPKVASLPEHAHIMGMLGCYERWPGKDDTPRQNGPCNDPEDALPQRFLPVHRTPTQYVGILCTLFNASSLHRRCRSCAHTTQSLLRVHNTVLSLLAQLNLRLTHLYALNPHAAPTCAAMTSLKSSGAWLN
jgi:hypothetical protein